MLTIINASQFQKKIFNPHFIAYQSSAQSLNSSLTLADALNPTTWRNHFDPFAHVMIDSQTQDSILIRDHLGIAPLYYWYQNDKLIFGDTIPDILQHLPKTPSFVEEEIFSLFAIKKIYSDNTLYQGIYRVEPGHLIHIKPNGTLEKKVFWQLEREGDTLYYSHDQDYLDHFSELMSQSTQAATKNSHNIAAEFSAGLDSSAVYCAAHEQNIRPKLYMHVARPESTAEKNYNDQYEKAFINHYQLTDIQRISNEHFDPLEVFQRYASWYAGPAPYIFFMFANNIFQAVSKEKHPILLSGFGGDQGISNPTPLCSYLPELFRQKNYHQAWRTLSANSPTRGLRQQLNQLQQFVKYSHPVLHQIITTMEELLQTRRAKTDLLYSPPHPYFAQYFRSTREAEWFFLQGPFSHEVRMRIEYSSVASKKMGFEYRYPLLHPNLLEFILSVPAKQKRRHGVGRYLIKRYLAQRIPEDIFHSYQKKEGLGIISSTFDLFQTQFEQGVYKEQFASLPYSSLIQQEREQMTSRNNIKAYMLQCWLAEQRNSP